MKHLRTLTVTRVQRADAYSDFLNTIWQAWLDFIYAKKNETLPSSS